MARPSNGNVVPEPQSQEMNRMSDILARKSSILEGRPNNGNVIPEPPGQEMNRMSNMPVRNRPVLEGRPNSGNVAPEPQSQEMNWMSDILVRKCSILVRLHLINCPWCLHSTSQSGAGAEMKPPDALDEVHAARPLDITK